MKQANRALARAVNNPDKHVESQRQQEVVFTAEDGQFMNNVFRQLEAILPAWRHQFPRDPEEAEESEGELKRQWMRGFKENHINSDSRVNAGLARARRETSPFAPSIGQFIEWCGGLEEELGLPSKEEAFQQAISRNSYRHPAVIYALRQILDPHRFSLAREREARGMWDEAWSKTVNYVLNGGELPKPSAPESTLEQKVEPATATEVERELSKLRELLRKR